MCSIRNKTEHIMKDTGFFVFLFVFFHFTASPIHPIVISGSLGRIGYIQLLKLLFTVSQNWGSRQRKGVEE